MSPLFSIELCALSLHRDLFSLITQTETILLSMHLSFRLMTDPTNSDLGRFKAQRMETGCFAFIFIVFVVHMIEELGNTRVSYIST